MRIGFSILASMAMALPATSSADTLPRNAWVEHGVATRVTNDGWNFITAELEEYVYESLAEQFVGPADIKLYDEGCFWEYTAYITNIRSVDYAFPTLELTAKDGYLDAYVRLDDLRMNFIMEGDGLFCADHYECSSKVKISSLEGGARLAFDVVNGRVKTSVSHAWAQVNNYEYDTEFWCFIIELVAEILESTIEESFESTLVDMMNTPLPGQLDELLVSSRMCGDIDFFDTHHFYDSRPEETINDALGTTIGMRTRFSERYGRCTPRENEFRYTDDRELEFPATIPGTSDSYEAAISISDDALNALLYGTYDSGALCIVLDENAKKTYGFPWRFTTADLRAVMPDLYQAYPNAPIRLDATPQTAPWAEIGEKFGILEGQLLAHLESVFFDLYVWDETASTWLRATRIDVLYEADILVRVNPKNKVRVLIAGFPNVTIEILEEDLVDLNDAAVERLLPRALQILTPLLVASLGEFPLPVIAGYGFDVSAIIPDGPNDNYLSIYGNLYEGEGFTLPLEPCDP